MVLRGGFYVFFSNFFSKTFLDLRDIAFERLTLNEHFEFYSRWLSPLKKNIQWLEVAGKRVFSRFLGGFPHVSDR